MILVHQAVGQHGTVVKTWEAPVDPLEFLALLSPPGPIPLQLTQDLSDPLPLTVASPPSQTSPLPGIEKSLPRREVRFHPSLKVERVTNECRLQQMFLSL